MPYLSLTDFVDVVSKAGVPKATKVAQVKNRGDYDPVTDFYKAFREPVLFWTTMFDKLASLALRHGFCRFGGGRFRG